MSTGDWLLLLGGATAVGCSIAYAIGKYVGRMEARPCSVCHDAERPRHDIHSSWRCVDLDGCNARVQRRVNPPAEGEQIRRTRWLEALTSPQGNMEPDEQQHNEETDPQEQENAPTYARLLDDL